MDGAADQLRRELFLAIRRWAQESDITLCEAIGVLELLKVDLITLLQVPDPT
jgi:hypothetical protein